MPKTEAIYSEYFPIVFWRLRSVMTHEEVATKNHQHSVHRRRRRHVEVNKRIDEDALLASSSGDVAWLEQTLRTDFKKALAQTKEQGFSTIHLAAMNGHLDCLKVLIKKQHVPVDCESFTGWRAVHLAINKRNKTRSLKCLNYLLEQGADPSKPNHNGFSPVHQAAATGQVNCLKSLIEAGATINACDSDNLMPVDYARIWGHRTCVRILNARQWHIDKEAELKHKQKVEEECQRMQEELEKLDVKEKAQKVEKNKAAFESWLMNKGLPDQLDHYEPFSTKSAEQSPPLRSKKSPSPVLPKVNTTGIMASSLPDPPVEDHYQPYLDEFDVEKKLDLIPLANISATKRKQRAQDTLRAMRDVGSHIS